MTTITVLTAEQKDKVLRILRLNGPIDPQDLPEEIVGYPKAALKNFLRSNVATEAAALGAKALNKFLSDDYTDSPDDDDSTDPALPEYGISQECIQGLRIFRK